MSLCLQPPPPFFSRFVYSHRVQLVLYPREPSLQADVSYLLAST